ncbi:MAG: hypothetical protein WC879_03455 [Melioribacteraceae bacterium]
MHIELEDKDKALKMVKPLFGSAPNRFINDFWDAVDPESFVNSLKQLMSEERGQVRLKVTIEKLNINQSKKD